MFTKRLTKTYLFSAIIGLFTYLGGGVTTVLVYIVFGNESDIEVLQSIAAVIILTSICFGIILSYFLARHKKHEFINKSEYRSFMIINLVSNIIPATLFIISESLGF